MAQTLALYHAVDKVFLNPEFIPQSFPRFVSRDHRTACISRSHAVRTGLENLGDQVMYLAVGYLVRKKFPLRPVSFYAVRVASDDHGRIINL